jgi:HSP20 family molecular chaperone IbpA
VLDLPGFAKSDVSIAVQPGKIVVSAERAPSASTKGKEKEFEQPEEIKWEVRERPEGKWVRELPLAVGVKVRSPLPWPCFKPEFEADRIDTSSLTLQPDEIKASMANGVLTITYPKQAAAETIQQVQIQ